jgi:hypothetical protein
MDDVFAVQMEDACCCVTSHSNDGLPPNALPPLDDDVVEASLFVCLFICLFVRHVSSPKVNQ